MTVLGERDDAVVQVGEQSFELLVLARNLLERALERRFHIVERVGQRADLVVRVDVYLVREFAGRDELRAAGKALYRRGDRL